MPDHLISFDTGTNSAFISLGALPPGQHWSRFDVPGKKAAEAKASVLVTTIWNFHWSRQGSRRIATKPAVFRDIVNGSLWYRMGRPGFDAPPTSTAHWNRTMLARKLAIPIVGVLKDYSTSKCSLRDTFKVVEVRDDKTGDAVWLHLQPARPFVSKVNKVNIHEETGSAAKEGLETSPDILAIDAMIRPAVSRTRQAWLSDVAKRRAIELYAMAEAIAHYKKTWPIVKDVSSKESFDLRCSNGDRELRVEVKGTSTGGGSILLTRNEVRHAEDPKNHVALFVMSGIIVDAANTCSGGVLSVIEPWQLDRDRLAPIAYEYHL